MGLRSIERPRNRIFNVLPVRIMAGSESQKKERRGRGRKSACRQTPGFWKPRTGLVIGWASRIFLTCDDQRTLNFWGVVYKMLQLFSPNEDWLTKIKNSSSQDFHCRSRLDTRNVCVIRQFWHFLIITTWSIYVIFYYQVSRITLDLLVYLPTSIPAHSIWKSPPG